MLDTDLNTSPRSDGATLKPASQRRSQRTLRRIVDAFAAALDEQCFEEVTVADVCRRAGCSVGTFYGRVASKDDLLTHLCEQTYEELDVRIRELTEDAGDDGGLEVRLRAQSRALVSLHEERRGVIRAVVVHARRGADFAAATRAFNDRLVAAFAGSWQAHLEEMGHPEPTLATERAAIMAAAFLREAVVFGHLWPGMEGAGATTLADELVMMILGYLGIERANGARSSITTDVHEETRT